MRVFSPYNKYGNKVTFLDGIRFASKLEAERYVMLKLAEKSGAIRDLKLQPVYKFPFGASYRADFFYIDKDGKQVAEDVKGVETEVFRFKKRCFEYYYKDIELRIVR